MIEGLGEGSAEKSTAEPAGSNATETDAAVIKWHVGFRISETELSPFLERGDICDSRKKSSTSRHPRGFQSLSKY